jgi:hypothetical protein
MSARREFLGAVFWVAVGLAIGPSGRARAQAPAPAAQDWRKEFEDLCAKTQDAMALPMDELKSLVSRCDKLKPQIEKLDESQRKVYSRRLQVCRDLYQFVIESREKG